MTQEKFNSADQEGVADRMFAEVEPPGSPKKENRSSDMFIQGNLQAVFDALYTFGAIDPVLKMDWAQISDEAAKNQSSIDAAIKSINSCSGNQQMLLEKLHKLDPKAVSFIAVEVAREFAEFTSRTQVH